MTKFNLREISEYTNIPQSTLHDFQKRNVKPSNQTIHKILQSLEKYCNILSYALQDVEPEVQVVKGRRSKSAQTKNKTEIKSPVNTSKLSKMKN